MASSSKIRRINLYGGPGTGKSTTASDLFAEFKRMCVDSSVDTQFELIQEFVKEWAWEKRSPQGFDQVFIFANQQRKEEIPLRGGVDHVFTDSPLFLGAAYARKYHSRTFNSLITLAELHEEEYPGLHIFLDRGDRPYVGKGRYEDEDKARRMDDYIRSLLDLYVGSDHYLVLPYDDWSGIVNTVASRLGLTEHLRDERPIHKAS
jgi:nicotinamide riboside kinase